MWLKTNQLTRVINKNYFGYLFLSTQHRQIKKTPFLDWPRNLLLILSKFVPEKLGFRVFRCIGDRVELSGLLSKLLTSCNAEIHRAFLTPIMDYETPPHFFVLICDRKMPQQPFLLESYQS